MEHELENLQMLNFWNWNNSHSWKKNNLKLVSFFILMSCVLYLYVSEYSVRGIHVTNFNWHFFWVESRFLGHNLMEKIIFKSISFAIESSFLWQWCIRFIKKKYKKDVKNWRKNSYYICSSTSAASSSTKLSLIKKSSKKN